MSDVARWILYYPHPDLAQVALVAHPFSGLIDDLWTLAKMNVPILADIELIGRAPPIFYIPIDLPIQPSNTLLSRSRAWLAGHRDDGRTALSVEPVQVVFPTVPSLDFVHILVVTNELLDGLDFVGNIELLVSKKRERGIKSFRDSLPTPSAGVSSFAGVEQVVQQCQDNFHTGRPAGNLGPPVSLFNSHLGRFDYLLRNLDDDSSAINLSPSLIKLTHQFMDISANTYSDEDNRMSHIIDILHRIFASPLNWRIPKALFGVKLDALGFGDTPFFVVEVKNEAGLEGDASLQAALSYAHIATSPLDKKYPAFRSNYPAVLYGIMGNLLEIGVATYTDGVYYNLLFSERLHLGFHAAKNVLRLARAFAATRLVINDLRGFYSTLPDSDSHSIAHFFPSPLPVPTYTDSVPSLTFTRRLSRSGNIVVLAEDEITRQSGIYLATMARPRSADEDGEMEISSSTEKTSPAVEVVVKFTAQYHPEAHRRLADMGFAPVLHACVPVCGGLLMVVMDRVHGKLAWDLVQRNELIPDEVYEDIRDAITLLHSDNLVFGDLRTPNIMVVPSGSGRCRGMLIDFDWVGEHGVGRYPASLDDALEWASPEIQRYGIMEKAHDIAMLNQFRDQCRSV